MIFLTTDRLILRSVAPEDSAVMHDYRNNEICARYQRGQVRDKEGIDALIQRHQKDILSLDVPALLAVALRETGEMIGEIVVMPQDGAISLGYTFSYRHHRQGYAYEALSALLELLHSRFPDQEFICFTERENIPSMSLFTERENIPSMSLLRKLGYQDLGYAPKIQSEIFGKWLTPASEAELRQATAQ